MIVYVESPKSIEASGIPTLTPGGSYYDPISETYVPGIKVEVDIEGLSIVTDAIVESIEQGFGSSANICSFLLPRSFDDYGAVDTGSAVEVKVNNRLLFNGKIRSIYPAQTDRGEMVRINASDARVEMQGIPFEKNGEYRIIYNERPTVITASNDSWTFTIAEYKNCGEILNDILSSCGIEIEEVSEVFSDFDPGETVFTDMNCAEAIDLLIQRAGNFRWWLTPEDKLIIHQIGTGDERVFYLGEKEELAEESNVKSSELSKSVPDLIDKVVFIGGKGETELSSNLEPDWDWSKEDTWNLDNKDEKEYKDIYRKYRIWASGDLMSRLITFPWSGPIVYTPDPDRPFKDKILEGYSIDYENKKVVFSTPQYKIADMETGEVEPIPIRIIYAEYGERLKVEKGSGDGVTRIMRDESYIKQAIFSDSIDAEMYDGVPHSFGRDDTIEAGKLAQAELDRYSVPDIRGSVELVGDETVDVAQRVSLFNAIGGHAGEYAGLKGSIVRLSHNLDRGYLILMDITNERPRTGMAPRRIPPEIRYSLSKDKDKIQKTGELLPRKDAIPEGHHPHQHKTAKEDGLALSVYASEEEE